jgi:hypothetical protein
MMGSLGNFNRSDTKEFNQGFQVNALNYVRPLYAGLQFPNAHMIFPLGQSTPNNHYSILHSSYSIKSSPIPALSV